MKWKFHAQVRISLVICKVKSGKSNKSTGKVRELENEEIMKLDYVVRNFASRFGRDGCVRMINPGGEEGIYE